MRAKRSSPERATPATRLTQFVLSGRIRPVMTARTLRAVHSRMIETVTIRWPARVSVVYPLDCSQVVAWPRSARAQVVVWAVRASTPSDGKVSKIHTMAVSAMTYNMMYRGVILCAVITLVGVLSCKRLGSTVFY